MKQYVAIVGRPNVGKSTLFNQITGKKISIVADTPGVTRDRIFEETSWGGKTFTLIDTGGIEPKTNDVILKQMRAQAELAVEMAEVVVFIVDLKSGLVDADYEVANILRRSKRKIILCVNKVDNLKKEEAGIYEFYNLGLGDPIAVSAENKQGIGDLLEKVVEALPEVGEEEDRVGLVKVALIGKPNAGKSSLINKILGENRNIVSDIAGTTRDAIDSHYKRGEYEYLFIDTAGIRRKSKITEDIEKYSLVRTIAAIERANIVIILIDATAGVTEADAHIAGLAHEAGKGIILAVNKWDAIEKDDKTMNNFTNTIRQKFSFMDYAEIIFISALTGQRVDKLFDLINSIYSNQNLRIQTGYLNEILAEAVAVAPPPTDKGKRLKIYYMTQTDVCPPHFLLFINDKELMHFSYTRYLENVLRERFGFRGTTLKFSSRERSEKDGI